MTTKLQNCGFSIDKVNPLITISNSIHVVIYWKISELQLSLLITCTTTSRQDLKFILSVSTYITKLLHFQPSKTTDSYFIRVMFRDQDTILLFIICACSWSGMSRAIWMCTNSRYITNDWSLQCILQTNFMHEKRPNKSIQNWLSFFSFLSICSATRERKTHARNDGPLEASEKFHPCCYDCTAQCWSRNSITIFKLFHRRETAHWLNLLLSPT